MSEKDNDSKLVEYECISVILKLPVHLKIRLKSLGCYVGTKGMRTLILCFLQEGIDKFTGVSEDNLSEEVSKYVAEYKDFIDGFNHSCKAAIDKKDTKGE